MHHEAISHAEVLELGCYDGKTIRFLEDAGISVPRYIGLDADWEKGLALGRRNYRGRPAVEFQRCHKPADVPTLTQPCEIGICMETLEHIPSEDVGPYLDRLAANITGTLFVTVPIERGLTFLCRQLLKRALRFDGQRASLHDLFIGTFGRLERVKRDHHLGFDDRVIVNAIAERFDLARVEPIMPGFGPHSCNFQLGIVARKRTV